MIESHHCTPELEQQASSIGREGFESLLRKTYYSKENKNSFEDFKKRINALRSNIKMAAGSVNNGEFVPASKTVRSQIGNTSVNGEKRSSSGSSFFQKRSSCDIVDLENEEEDGSEQKENELAGSKEASIQSTFSYYGMNQNKIPQPLAKKPSKPKPPSAECNSKDEQLTDERLVGIDSKLIEIITSEVIQKIYIP